MQKRIILSNGTVVFWDDEVETATVFEQRIEKAGHVIVKIETLVNGTPKTLDEAIENFICIGPLNEMSERSYHVLRDFMAQKFGTAYLEAGDDSQMLEILERLFRALTKRVK